MNGPATLEEIAAELGLSTDRVRQIEVEALVKARLLFRLEELLGPVHAAPVLASLEHAKLPAIHRAMMSAESAASRRSRS